MVRPGQPAYIECMKTLKPDPDADLPPVPRTEGERLAAIDAALGAMAHAAFSTDDLFQEKQQDKVREERHWKHV